MNRPFLPFPLKASRMNLLTQARPISKTNVVIFVCSLFALLGFVAKSHAQPPQGPGGPGGPNAPDKEIVKDFDVDGDGVLNKAERKKARAMLKKEAQSGGFGGRRRGRGGRRGGPPGGGAELVKGKVGKRVLPEDVKNFPDAGLYAPATLRTIFIKFENKDWEKELADFKPTDVEIPAELTVDGKTYPNVGVSFRGASSFFMIPEGLKRSLNLSMDFMDDDQKLYGYKSLNLLNCNGDPSLMSSFLYSHIARQKIAAPKVNFVNVVINGRSWGVYANAQQFNKDFLKENYGSKKGSRWKVSGNPRGDAGLRYLGEEVDEYRSRFDIKSKENEKSWNDLIQLCKLLNETPADQLIEKLDPILDLDGVLWFLAVDVALINSDGYWTRASDYSIYQNPEGKFHILPHDMNESFREMHGRGGPGGPSGRRGRGGRRGGPPGFGGPGGPPGDGPPPEFDGPPRGRPPGFGGTPGRGGGTPGGSPPLGQGYELDPLTGLGEDRFPLRSKLLANPTLKTRYLQYVRLIAREHIAWEKMRPLVSNAKKLIESEVKADTRLLVTFDAFENATGESAAKGSLREFAEKRSKFLLDHPVIKDLPEALVELSPNVAKED